MSDLVKTRAMLRWHIPVGQVAIDGRSWWQVACGRTIRQASALTASAAGRDLCAVCARSVVAVTDETLCDACGDTGEVDCRDCSGTGIGHGGHLCGTCLGAGAEPCPRCVRSKR